MKTTKVIFASLTIMLVGISCQKNIKDTNARQATQLLASKTSVKTGETISLKVVQDISQGTMPLASRWSVSPVTGVTIDSVYSFSENTISFSVPGVYIVNADLRKVQCSPEAAAHPGLDTCFNSGTDFTKISNTITVNN